MWQLISVNSIYSSNVVIKFPSLKKMDIGNNVIKIFSSIDNQVIFYFCIKIKNMVDTKMAKFKLIVGK